LLIQVTIIMIASLIAIYKQTFTFSLICSFEQEIF
jgi:hypothetical protein